MGLFDDFVDVLSETADEVSEAVDSTIDDISAVVDEFFVGVDETSEDLAAALAETPADVIETISAADDELGGVFGSVLDTLDDTVFDAVDFVTGGLVDVDFDDGTFAASIGIDGVHGVSVSFGEEGFEGDLSYGGLFDTSASLSADRGVVFDISAGIDFGPLPMSKGHAQFAPNGDLTINGELQGTIPLEGVLLTVDAKGGLHLADDINAAFVDAEAAVTLPNGLGVGVGLKGSLAHEADGDLTLSAGSSAEVEFNGLVSASIEQTISHIESDGVVIDQARVDIEGAAVGVKAEVGGAVTGVAKAGGASIVDGSVTGDIGFDIDTAADAALKLVGVDKALEEAGLDTIVNVITGDGAFEEFAVDLVGEDAVKGVEPKAPALFATDQANPVIAAAQSGVVQSAFEALDEQGQATFTTMVAATEQPVVEREVIELDEPIVITASPVPLVAEREVIELDEPIVITASPSVSEIEPVFAPEIEPVPVLEPEAERQFDADLAEADSVESSAEQLFDDL